MPFLKPSPGNRNLFTAVAILLIVLAAFAIYGNIFSFPFVFDDVPCILENPEIGSPSRFFSPSLFLRSRQVVNLTFALNYALGGHAVFGYHLVNVLIHVLNGVVVYFLALTFLRAVRGRKEGLLAGSGDPVRLIPLFTALLFIVHPLQTQAVTYTIQRYTSMAAMFYMLSVLFYLKARLLQVGEGLSVPSATAGQPMEKTMGAALGKSEGKEKKKKARKKNLKLKPDEQKVSASSERKAKVTPRIVSFFAVSLLTALVAFRCKENTMSLPMAILLTEYFAVDRSWQRWKRKLLWTAAALAALVLLYLAFAGAFRQGFSPDRLLSGLSTLTRETDQVGRWEYLCTQFNVLVIYLRLLFFPVNQNLDYMYPFKSGFFAGATPYAFLFLLTLIVLAYSARKKYPVVSFGVFWFFITLSVESSLFPIKDALFEHRIYLPLFGFAFLLTDSIFLLCGDRRAWAAGLSALLIISYGSASFLRNQVWKDEYTLWTDVVRKNPGSIRGYNYLGSHYQNEGDLDGAVALLKRALAVSPQGGDAITHYNLANALKKSGDLDEAAFHYEEAIRMDSAYTSAYINLGNVFRDRGDCPSALAYYEQALRIDRYDKNGINNMVTCLVREGRYEEASERLKDLIRRFPGDLSARYNLALALNEAGKRKEATSEMEELLRLDPANARALFGLAGILEGGGQKERALEYYRRTLEADRGFTAAGSFRIARLLAGDGRFDESMDWLEKAASSGYDGWEAIKEDRLFDEIRKMGRYEEIRKKRENSGKQLQR